MPSTRQQLHAGMRTSIRTELVAEERGLVEPAVRQRRVREHDQDLGRRGAVQTSDVRPRASRIPGASRGEPERELHRRGCQRLAREVIPNIQCLLISRELIDQQPEEGPRCRFCAAGYLECLGQGRTRGLIVVLRDRLAALLDQIVNDG